MKMKLFKSKNKFFSFFKKNKSTEINNFRNHANKTCFNPSDEDFLVNVNKIPYNLSTNLESNCVYTDCKKNTYNFNFSRQSDEYICLLINGVNFFINAKCNIIYTTSNDHLHKKIMNFPQFYSHVLHILFVNNEK